MNKTAVLRRRRQGKIEPPVITATVTPALGALADGDQVQDALAASATQAGNYASTEGTIQTPVATVTIDGSPGSLTDTVIAGEVVSVSITVSDNAGNSRPFSAGSQTVAAVAPVASNAIADQTYTNGSAITPLDVSADFTGTAPITYALAPSSASLPAGLSLSSAGELTGTPTADTAQVNIVVRGTNSVGFADTAFGVTVQAEADTTAPTIHSFTVTAPATPGFDPTCVLEVEDNQPGPTDVRLVATTAAQSYGSGDGNLIMQGLLADGVTTAPALSAVTALDDNVSTNIAVDVSGFPTDATVYVYAAAEDAEGNRSIPASGDYFREAVFDPASIFAASDRGFYFTSADPSSMAPNADGTGAAITAGDTVQYHATAPHAGTEFNATNASSATSPVYQTDGSKGWLDFSGDHLQTSSYTAVSASGFFASACIDRTLGATGEVIDNDSTGNRSSRPIRILSDNRIACIVFDSSNNVLANFLTPVDSLPASGLMVISSVVTSNLVEIFVNGTSVLSQAYSPSNGMGSVVPVTLMNSGRGLGSPVNSKLHGALMISRPPTGTERQDVETALGKLGGLTL